MTSGNAFVSDLSLRDEVIQTLRFHWKSSNTGISPALNSENHLVQRAQSGWISAKHQVPALLPSCPGLAPFLVAALFVSGALLAFTGAPGEGTDFCFISTGKSHHKQHAVWWHPLLGKRRH